ncbi:hypothetical protein RHSIM_Rhsim12G0119500 [Rhododendron simsii]|uniref:BURP domain-containing protein n=1 Tax=Rhododendron simsii TaxID=118357 RepID=A0A834L9K9_RHOSS|nr:hypothetical protein RHSIM_Rhsim12G0119500 [Rhododendron simsii]
MWVTAAEAGANPFTLKASLIHYWKIQISKNLPKPWFLLNKASPFTAVESDAFSKPANDRNAIANHLQCSSTDLLCFPDLSPTLDKHNNNADYKASVGDSGNAAVDSFPNYIDQSIVGDDGFAKYDKSSTSSMGMMMGCKAMNRWVEPVDFAISVLERKLMVRTTENNERSKKGRYDWKGYRDQRRESHQVKEVDKLDKKTKVKINHGVAICHVDTSSWSAGHRAFMALGLGLCKIEFGYGSEEDVCELGGGVYQVGLELGGGVFRVGVEVEILARYWEGFFSIVEMLNWTAHDSPKCCFSNAAVLELTIWFSNADAADLLSLMLLFWSSIFYATAVTVQYFEDLWRYQYAAIQEMVFQLVVVGYLSTCYCYGVQN